LLRCLVKRCDYYIREVFEKCPPGRKGGEWILSTPSSVMPSKNPQSATAGRRRDARDPIGAEVAALNRLGFGRLSHPQIESWIARVLLFYRMGSTCKSDLIELRGSCLPGCSALFDFGRQQLPGVKPADFPHVAVETQNSATRICSELVYIDSWEKLRAAASHQVANEWVASLESWATPRHLCVDWFFDALIKILCDWHVDPEAARRLRFGFPGSLGHTPHQRFGSVGSELRQRVNHLVVPVPAPTIPVYNPAAQTREEHIAVVQNLLHGHHLEQERRFRTAGFRATIVKRARSGRAWDHMDWFISFQIHNRTAAEIAAPKQKNPIGENAVNQAIGKLARVLDIPLRSGTSTKDRKVKLLTR
jgi:hypothetical protein